MLKTEKDYSDPFVRQLSLFLDNRVGKLREILRYLTSEDILVHSITVIDSADYAIVRIIVDRVGTAQQILVEHGVPTSVNPILAVEVPNERAGLSMICRSLIQAEINIHYVYPFLAWPKDRPVPALGLEDEDVAIDVLTRNNLRVLSQEDLAR